MAGLKKFIQNLHKKENKEIENSLSTLGIELGLLSIEIAKRCRFLKANSCSASTQKITVGTETVVLTPGDIVYVSGGTPEVWLCVNVTASATTNLKLK